MIVVFEFNNYVQYVEAYILKGSDCTYRVSQNTRKKWIVEVS